MAGAIVALGRTVNISSANAEIGQFSLFNENDRKSGRPCLAAVDQSILGRAPGDGMIDFARAPARETAVKDITVGTDGPLARRMGSPEGVGSN